MYNQRQEQVSEIVIAMYNYYLYIIASGDGDNRTFDDIDQVLYVLNQYRDMMSDDVNMWSQDHFAMFEHYCRYDHNTGHNVLSFSDDEFRRVCDYVAEIHDQLYPHTDHICDLERLRADANQALCIDGTAFGIIQLFNNDRDYDEIDRCELRGTELIHMIDAYTTKYK